MLPRCSRSLCHGGTLVSGDVVVPGSGGVGPTLGGIAGGVAAGGVAAGEVAAGGVADCRSGGLAVLVLGV